MKTIRTLAAAALTTLGLAAGIAPAQGNLPGSGIPRLVAENQSNLTHETLSNALKSNNHFEVKEIYEKGSSPYVAVKHDYNPKGTKVNYNWSVTVQVVGKTGQSPMARVWFQCQILPKDVDATRLRTLMTWNGGHDESRGYFSLAKHKDGEMLSLMVDIPASDVTADGMQTALFALFQMAHETSGLWAGKLNEPIAKVEKKAEKPGLTNESLVGMWEGKVYLDGDKVGEYAVTFEKGWVTVSRCNTTVKNPTIDMLVGTYSVDGNKLTCTYTKVKEPEVYEVELDGKNLVLILRQGKSVLKIELKKSN